MIRIAIVLGLLAVVATGGMAVKHALADNGARGKLRHKDVHAKIRGARAELDACLDYADESGQISMRLTIASDGAVLRVKPSWSTSATQCIAKEIERLRFRATRGPSELTVKLSFAPPPPSKKKRRPYGVIDPFGLE